ncbi:MAG: hypothetical protein LIO58_04860 [Oscillospiraceae bacterium]|nr:hypothetical protein [Oscillospiraceae bacterium]
MLVIEPKPSVLSMNANARKPDTAGPLSPVRVQGGTLPPAEQAKHKGKPATGKGNPISKKAGQTT